MKNILQRTVSGIVYLAVIIASLFLGKYAFGALFLMVGLFALMEFYRLLGFKQFSVLTIMGMISGAGIFTLSFLIASGMIGLGYFAVAAIFPVITLITTLYMSRRDIIREVSVVFLSLFYIAIPLAMLNYLVFPPVNGLAYTHRIVLGIFILVWINDTGAYLSGMSFGRHKLFPRISPKKSWEGLAGGTLFTILASLWMDRVMGILEITDWVVLALMVSIFGIFGDLTESMIKRYVNAKDSGTLIPGHGGVLDRFDSLLFVLPAAFIYLVLSGFCQP